MEDIYGDLENYNDVNIVDELRSENKCLKIKLEEYASSMEKLQKNILQDFDKLSSEFKRLEINYSSLLKTARAEIERKTQIISNLNIEKDMMVLNSIQNSNKSILNLRRNLTRDRSNIFKKTRRDVECKSSLPESKKFEAEKDRDEENRLPSIDTASTINSDDGNNFSHCEKKLTNIDPYKDKGCESKENVAKVKSRALSIRNRRKSMPLLGRQLPKFSSDDDMDDNYSTEEANKNDWPPREDKNRRTERNINEKQIQKTSESPGINEKYSSHRESSREPYYKTKSSRYGDKYRSMGTREKYEQSHRYRRHYSPDGPHRRMTREHPDEQYQRIDFGRHRVLESPPPDRYERKNRDRRFNVERNKPYDDRSKYRYEKNHGKHKILSDYDEPSHKRARTDSSGKHPEDDRRQHREPVQPQITTPLDHLHITSCQSPDYINIESDSVQPVKEIMDTAASQLEDPRLSNKNYITKMVDNKIILSTVTGRNVELKRIDTSTWDIERVDVPKALQRPPHYSDDIVNELYMDIGNPVSNMSMESGEIGSESNDLDIETESYLNEENDITLQKNITDSHLGISETQVENLTQTANLQKYKIPTTKKHDILPHSEIPKTLDGQSCSTSQDKKSSEVKKSDQLLPKQTDHSLSSDKKQIDKSSDLKYLHKLREDILSCKEIVEGDLELSDETCDNVEMQNQCTVNIHNSQSIIQDKEIKKKEQGKCLEVEEVSGNIKKDKSKKKSQKPKESTAKEVVTATETSEIGEKKTKSKKEAKPKEMKAKFCDLFGDSSSLITPEDLGVEATEPHSQTTNKYVPFFEDALDANDVHVEEITKVQTRSSKVAVDTVIEECQDRKDETEIKPKLKTNKGNKSIVDNKKKKSKINEKICNLAENKKETANSLENLVGKKVIKESDVVNTVIISTGVQPQIIPKKIGRDIQEPLNITLVDESKNNNNINAEQPTVVSALATSTPYKEAPKYHAQIETDTKQPESSCNSSDIRVTKNEGSSFAEQSSLSNGTEYQNDVDVPDVRIFVRRRRKGLKKVDTSK